MGASGSASSVAVSGMRNNRRVALGTTEGTLGLPVTPGGGGWCGWGNAPWSRVWRRGLAELLEGPGSGEVRMGDGDGVVVRWTVWWVYLGLRGDTGDVVMEGTRRRSGLCTGITGVRVAVLGSILWEYRGCAAVLGSSTVGILRGRLAVLGCPPDPSNIARGVQGHPLAP